MQNIYQNEGKRLLRTREFAERLGISVATLYRLIAAGKLPPPRAFFELNESKGIPILSRV
jgi:predicted DNA-binding transcriptional regulator AlpA